MSGINAGDPAKSHYDVLGVGRDATQKDITRSYRRAAREGRYRHPDFGGSREEFAKLEKAYFHLRDPKRRKEYDKTLPATYTRRTRRPSFTFGRQVHREPRSLAEHMGREWDEACGLLSSPRLDELGRWLKQTQPSLDVQGILDSCHKKQFHPDRLVAMLISALAPTLPPAFRAFAVDRPSLIGLVEQAVKGEARERDIVHRLRASHALMAFERLPKCDGYGNLDDQWQQTLREYYTGQSRFLNCDSCLPVAVNLKWKQPSCVL